MGRQKRTDGAPSWRPVRELRTWGGAPPSWRRPSRFSSVRTRRGTAEDRAHVADRSVALIRAARRARRFEAESDSLVAQRLTVTVVRCQYACRAGRTGILEATVTDVLS